MIAGRSRHHPEATTLVIQKQKRVPRSALLKTSGSLQVIQLAKNLGANCLRQWLRVWTRRVVDSALDTPFGRLDVREREHGGRIQESGARIQESAERMCVSAYGGKTRYVTRASRVGYGSD